MLTTARSFLASQRDASKLVQEAKKFSVRLPVVGTVSVPPPDQLAFYGVLGLLAAVEVIDWPVALAIGIGQAVVARHFADQNAAATAPTAVGARAGGPQQPPRRRASPLRARRHPATPLRERLGPARPPSRPRSKWPRMDCSTRGVNALSHLRIDFRQFVGDDGSKVAGLRAPGSPARILVRMWTKGRSRLAEDVVPQRRW